MLPEQVFYPVEKTPAITIAGALAATITHCLFIAKSVKAGD
jgi:hypothetical protein